jgi:putative aldouronate transport system permease protein
MTVLTASKVRRRPSNRPAWEEKPTAVGQVGKGGVLIATVAIVLIPIYMVVMTSLSTQKSVNLAGGMVFIPRGGITVEAYRQILDNPLILHSLWVSVWTTVVGTVLSMVVSVLAAYGLSRRGSFGHRTLLTILIITMFFNGGIIPGFLLVSSLGMYGTYWSLILPSAVSVFNILIIRGFFAATSEEMIEAARLDGAGEWRTLWSIVLPTSKAVVAVNTLFYAMGYWGAFFSALLYLPDNGMWPLQRIIYTYTIQGNSMPGSGVTTIGQNLGHQAIAPLSLQMAVVTLTLVPIIVVTPFMQKHFTKGVLLGAVKG